MAPVPHEVQARYAPLIVVISHITAVFCLTCSICVGLFRSHTTLRPSQDTRLRISNRKKVTPVFAALAVVSLATSLYHATNYMVLSYNVWAGERGVVPSNSLFGSASQTTNGTSDNSPYMHLRMWLTDVPIYRDAIEIVSEKARRFWWGNQQGLATISWSMLLAIEGRRRKIPFLWAYLLLAHLTNLSFAQNLFYLTVLLTPTPLAGATSTSGSRLSRLLAGVFPPKPDNWCPNPGLFLVVLILNYASLALLPYLAGSPSFPIAMSITSLLTFSPIILPVVMPETWGTVHAHPHDAYGAYTSLFRFISITSTALHTKGSVSGLMYNLPESHSHRHSILMPFGTEERSQWERTTTAVGKVLGSLSDHPAVAAVASDVLLSTLSLGLWAAMRSLDVDDILVSSIPYYDPNSATGTQAAAESESPVEDAHPKQQPEQPTETRRSGRPRKSAFPSIGTSSDSGVTTPESNTRRRGRLRKVKPDPDQTTEDGTYVPAQSVAQNIIEGDEVLDEDDWEAASLAWGLTVFGGLGTGAAGVFGAECISR